MRDNSAEILFQSAIIDLHGQGHPLFDVIRPASGFLCWPRHCSSSRGVLRHGFARPLWRRVRPKPLEFLCLDRVAKWGPCGLTKKLILLRTQSLVCAPSIMRCGEASSGHLAPKAWRLFSVSQQAAQSTTTDHIRAEGDFHKQTYSWKDQQGRDKTGRTEWENGELSGEFMEWNKVERAIREKLTQEQNKKEWASSVDLFLGHKP